MHCPGGQPEPWCPVLLTDTSLAETVVRALGKFNIHSVEQLLSFGRSAPTRARLAIALDIPEPDLAAMLDRLAAEHPKLEVPPAEGPVRPLGHLVKPDGRPRPGAG
jgi:hypothetical protein